MNPAETSYTARLPYPSMYQRGRAATASIPLYYGGTLVAPTASGSSYSLYDPSGTAIISGRAVSVSSSVAQVSLSAGDLPSTLTLGEGYQEVWTLVLPDGTTRTFDHPAAVILRPLYPVITDADLEAVYPDLSSWRGSAVKDMQGWIDEAWKQIIGRLIGGGHLPYLVKDSWAFREAHTHLTLALWAAYASKGRPGANFLELAAVHREAWETAWKQINFRVDADHDGRPDDKHARSPGVPTVLLTGGRGRGRWT